mmetsp:Transcript_14250/g.24903  ORF Transcript_14250/g.24903 Transcript_14250/m.24903 type:complete len:1260 (-) Transcript_14250:140-3919(-)
MSTSLEADIGAKVWQHRAQLSDDEQEVVSLLSQSCGTAYATNSHYLGRSLDLACDSTSAIPTPSTAAADGSEATESDVSSLLSDQEVLATSRQFHEWYERVEAACAKSMSVKYDAYADELSTRSDICRKFLEKINATLDLGDDLIAAQKDVSARAKSISSSCDGLLREKETLCEFAEALRDKLQFFEEFEAVSAQISATQQQLLTVNVSSISKSGSSSNSGGSSSGGNRSSGSSNVEESNTVAAVDSSFLQLLRRLDGCMAHVAAHPHYADAAPYSAKFRQLLGRALTTLRHKVQHQLKAIVQDIQTQAVRQQTQMSYSEGDGAWESLTQAKFRNAVTSSLKALLVEIERQALSGRTEYVQILRECRTLYSQARLALQGPHAERRVASLALEAAAITRSLSNDNANNANNDPTISTTNSNSNAGTNTNTASIATFNSANSNISKNDDGSITPPASSMTNPSSSSSSRLSFVWNLFGRKNNSAGGGVSAGSESDSSGSPHAADNQLNRSANHESNPNPTANYPSSTETLSETSLPQFVQSCTDFLAKICETETNMYLQFFRNQIVSPVDRTGAGFAAFSKKDTTDISKPSAVVVAPLSDPRRVAEAVSESLVPLLDPISGLLYETVRPVVVQIHDIASLCAVAEAFRIQASYLIAAERKEYSNWPSEVGKNGGEEVQVDLISAIVSPFVTEAIVSPVLLRCVADVQSRILYRCQMCVKDQITNFRPSEDDLDFPDRLFKASAKAALEGEGRIRRDAERDFSSSLPSTSPSEFGSESSTVVFPPLRLSLELLTWLHRSLDPNVFSGLALEVVEATTSMIGNVTRLLAQRPLSPLAKAYTLWTAGVIAVPGTTTAGTTTTGTTTATWVLDPSTVALAVAAANAVLSSSPSGSSSPSSPSPSSSPSAAAAEGVLGTAGVALHAQLFAIRHLLLLREKVATFNDLLSSFSADCTPLNVDLDFTHVRDNLRWLLAGHQGLFFNQPSSGSSLVNNPDAADGHRKDLASQSLSPKYSNGVMVNHSDSNSGFARKHSSNSSGSSNGGNLASPSVSSTTSLSSPLSLSSSLSSTLGASTPRVVTYRTDSRRDLDRKLKATCESLIMGLTRTVVEPMLTFITKVTAYKVGGGAERAIAAAAAAAAASLGTEGKEKETGSNAGNAQPEFMGPLRLKEQAFAAPSRIKDMLRHVNEALDLRLPAAAAAVRLHLPAAAARRVLLLPVRANVLEAHAQTRALLDTEYGGPEAAEKLGIRFQTQVEAALDVLLAE